jgi:hypothetical protein
MTEHELKTWPGPFSAVLDGSKRFEWRKYDRDFHVGDTLLLREWDNDKEDYTGRAVSVECLYMISNVFGIPKGYCVMSISDPTIVRM